MRSVLISLAFLAFGGARVSAAGLHLGELKDVAVDVEYFDYVDQLPGGEPVYYIGSNMRYRVTLKNEGKRSFDNFQLKSTLVWVGDWSCVRWWLDNQSVDYHNGEPLPGNSSTGWRSADMGPEASTSIEASYFLPLQLCPGRAELLIEGRHRNASGREDTGSFRFPIGVTAKRR